MTPACFDIFLSHQVSHCCQGKIFLNDNSKCMHAHLELGACWDVAESRLLPTASVEASREVVPNRCRSACLSTYLNLSCMRLRCCPLTSPAHAAHAIGKPQNAQE